MDDRGRIPTLLLLGRLGRVARAELLAFRDAQLRRVVRHAYARVPLYRRLFDDHGVRPENIRTADDLPRLPLTSREELQVLPLSDRLERGADPERLIARHTSGSSGRPLTIYRTWAEARIAMAIRLRALHDLGARPSDRRADIVVERQAPHPHNRRRPQRALMALGVFPKIDLDLRDGLPAIVEALCRWQPDLLLGYPSVLARLAGLLTDDVRAALSPRLIPNTLVRMVATAGRGWVQQFQLVQDRRDRVVLRVIPAAAPSEGDVARMRETARDVLGAGTALEIQLVDHIESEASGKFRVSRALEPIIR